MAIYTQTNKFEQLVLNKIVGVAALMIQLRAWAQRLINALNTEFQAIQAKFPNGNVIGDSDTQTLSNKTLTNPQINGLDLAITTKTAAYTATSADDTILCDASGGAFTVSLPAAAAVSGKVYVIKKIDSSANAVTIDPNGSETIDGATTNALSSQNQRRHIQSDGTNWQRIE